jgi:MFS transporter, FHS family, L-fucose permease
MTTTKAPLTENKYIVTFAFVTALFMLWGIAITMGDVLNRHFQSVLNLSKEDSGLVQFSIFGAYAVMGIPAGIFMKKFGYKNGVLFGLSLYALGAFLFIPSANAESFTFFRVALFVLACGLATLETVAHPFIAGLGDQQTSDQRINFGQSFNGLGAVLGPIIGGRFILREGQGYADELFTVKMLYIVIGVVITITCIAFALVKVPPVQDSHHGEADPETKLGDAYKTLFKRKHFVWAIIAQFFNCAAQGGTWAFFINYGNEKMGISNEEASYYFSVSMAMMMIGRFIGTYLMRFIKPHTLLAAFAMANILMCIIVAQSFGWVSFIALIMINFFFSIMFPTIFSLGLKDLGPATKQGSSFIVMGVVGAAVFPILMGKLADTNTATAYYLPILCYFVIFLFGWKMYKVRPAKEDKPVATLNTV